MLLRLIPFKGPRARRNKQLAKTACFVVCLVFFLVVFIDRTPSKPSTQESWHPKDTNRPRYLHYSSFRENPDLEYEKELTQALRAIEDKEKSKHLKSRNPAHVDTIWQVLLKDPDRPQDSLELEDVNPDWEYKVGIAAL